MYACGRPSSRVSCPASFTTTSKASLKFLPFLPLNMACSNLLPPTPMVPMVVIAAIAPAFIAMSFAYSCAAAKSMPELRASFNASSYAPPAVPPNDSETSRTAAVPSAPRRPISSANPFPASLNPALMTLPVPPLASKTGISCRTSFAMYSDANTPGSVLIAVPMALIVFHAFAAVDSGVPSGLVFNVPSSLRLALPMVF